LKILKQRIFPKDYLEQNFDKEINNTFRTNRMLISNSKSMANIFSPSQSALLGAQQSFLMQQSLLKPLSEKYQEFFNCLNSKNQILTHIELNTIEMKGNVSIAIVDILSYLRRRQDLQKLPKWIIEYLK